MTKELFDFDREFGCLVGGMDEAGRGPLAGPVVCAAVIMPLDNMIDGINDSKKLSEAKREELYPKIIKAALCFGVGVVEREVIDEINILNATKLGMKKAAAALTHKPEILIIDAVKLELPYKTLSLIKGDSKSYNVAAASVIAKVTRDRMMKNYALQYPGYGFERNKGYGTTQHIEALRKLGACALHRETFIKNFEQKVSGLKTLEEAGNEQ